MRLVRLGAGVCVVSCLLVWLVASHGQAGGAPRSGAGQTGSPGVQSGVESLAALRAEVGQVSRRLRDLEYPELRARDPREIQILQQLVDAREGLFKAVKAMHAAGATSSSEVAAAHYHLAAARAELAWPKQDVHEAVSRLVEAADSAAEMTVLSRADYAAGKTTLVSVVEAQALWAKTKLALIRAEKVAAVAKVDISDIKRDGGKRRKEAAPTYRPPALVPPPAAETERR